MIDRVYNRDIEELNRLSDPLILHLWEDLIFIEMAEIKKKRLRRRTACNDYHRDVIVEASRRVNRVVMITIDPWVDMKWAEKHELAPWGPFYEEVGKRRTSILRGVIARNRRKKYSL